MRSSINLSPNSSEFYQLDQKLGNWRLSMSSPENSQRVRYFDFKEVFGENLDAGNLVSFYDRVQERKIRPVLPSAYSLVHLSQLVDQKTIDRSFSRQRSLEGGDLRLVKFYKKGCKSCSAIKPFYEELTQTVLKIQSEIKDLESQKKSYDYRSPSLMSSLGIKNPRVFKNLRMSRFDVYNDVRSGDRCSDLLA